MNRRRMLRWMVAFAILHGAAAQNFTCKNGAVISALRFCDNIVDCADGSDEIPSNSSCPLCNYPQISCLVNTKSCLVHRDYVCNSTIWCIGPDMCTVGCPSHYRCQNGQCVRRSTLCDGMPCFGGCPEDDKWPNGVGFKCVRKGKICRLPQQLLRDNVADCTDGLDLCYVTNSSIVDGREIKNLASATFDSQKCTKCLDGSTIISRKRVCDGIVDCPDLSDECLCPNPTASICASIKLRSESGPCPVGQVSCKTSNGTTCFNRTGICDGVVDCPNNMDEKFSYCRGTLPCNKGLVGDRGACRCVGDPRYESDCRVGAAKRRRSQGILCNGAADCGAISPGWYAGWNWLVPPGFPQDECASQCLNRPFNCTYPWFNVNLYLGRLVNCSTTSFQNNTLVTTSTMTTLTTEICNGYLYCDANGADEKNCTNRFVCASGLKISIANSQVCDGYKDCDNGMDEDRQLCRHRFFCAASKGQRVSISMKAVCDFRIDCDKAEDEINCTQRFYCENKKPLFVRLNKVLNGIRDCSDWSDECSLKFKSSANILSSRYELIGNVFLRGLVWIMAFVAFFGNLVVIIGEVRALKQQQQADGAASLRANHMLVLNLAVADFLMAVYLFMLGIAGAAYSGSYCAQSIGWLTSTSCDVMGVLVVLSSETSVVTMVLLTGARMYAIWKPIESLSKPTTPVVLAMICLSWAVSFTLALIPVSPHSQHTFVERALVESNPFFGHTVAHFDVAKNYTLKLATYSQHLSQKPVVQRISAMTTWDDIHSFAMAYPGEANLLKMQKFFGYYSANSVCIPNLFVTTKDFSWRYSIAISTINFLAFVFVAFTYAAIMWKASKSADSTGRSRQNADLQRKIIRLIVTDFCCWIPLSIMVFVNFSGVQIDSVSYAVAAIVLLPINSALNPILYSSFVDRLANKLRQLWAKRFGQQSKNLQLVNVQHQETQ